MKLFRKMLRLQLVPTLIAGLIYTVAFLIMILVTNSNSSIYFKISPYAYSSDVVDFFLGLIVSVPFSIHTFFMKKNGFLDCVAAKTSKKHYLRTFFAATLLMCFLMVFLANIIAVLVSCGVATVETSIYPQTLSGYVLGDLQMSAPILFGVIWSLHKAFIGMLICLFAQIIALYVDNLFLTLCAPYAYIILENFITAVLQIPNYSISTAFVLNRLASGSTSAFHIATSVFVFMLVIGMTYTALSRWYKKSL